MTALRYGRRRKVDLQLLLGPSFTVQWSLVDREPALTEPKPYDQLPEAFRRRVDEAAKRMGG